MAAFKRFETAHAGYSALSRARMSAPVIDFGHPKGELDKPAQQKPAAPRKNGQNIKTVQFADQGGAFGWMNGSKGIDVVYDGTGIGLKKAIDAKMKEKGIDKNRRAPVLDLPQHPKAQGSFDNEDLGGYVVKGGLPARASNLKARGATFTSAAGGMTAPKGDFTNATFNGVNADHLKARGANFTGMRVVGAGATANHIKAQGANFGGDMFDKVTHGDLRGSRIARMDHVEAGYVAFSGAKLASGFRANGARMEPAMVARDPARAIHVKAAGLSRDARFDTSAFQSHQRRKREMQLAA